MATKEGKHKHYGPKMSNPRHAESKEHRYCGPIGKLTRALASNKVQRYVRPVSQEELDYNRVRAQLSKRIHISFASPKAARLAGSMIEIYEAQSEKLPVKRAQIAADD